MKFVINAFNTGDEILIIDPEQEYGRVERATGGEIINIFVASPNHINAMDVSREYGNVENPIILKSEFILSLCEMAVDTGVLSAKEKSLIDRYIASTYKSYPEEPFHIVLFDIAIQAPPPIAPFFKNNLQLKGNCDIIEVN